MLARCIGLCTGVACLASVAHAQPARDAELAADAAPVREPSAVLWRFQAYPQLVHADDEGYAAGAGTTVWMVLEPLELGIGAAAEMQLIGYQRAQLAAHLGLRVVLESIELDMAATLGVASVHTPSGFLDDDPGGVGGVGFAGGRAGFVVRAVDFSRSGRVHLDVGLAVGYEHDLAHYEIGYWYASRPWLIFDGNEPSSVRRGSAWIGTDRQILTLTFSLALD